VAWYIEKSTTAATLFQKGGQLEGQGIGRVKEETQQLTTKADSMIAQEGEQGSGMVAMAVGGEQ